MMCSFIAGPFAAAATTAATATAVAAGTLESSRLFFCGPLDDKPQWITDTRPDELWDIHAASFHVCSTNQKVESQVVTPLTQRRIRSQTEDLGSMRLFSVRFVTKDVSCVVAVVKS